jgi:hypothetical protein
LTLALVWYGWLLVPVVIIFGGLKLLFVIWDGLLGPLATWVLRRLGYRVVKTKGPRW